MLYKKGSVHVQNYMNKLKVFQTLIVQYKNLCQIQFKNTKSFIVKPIQKWHIVFDDYILGYVRLLERNHKKYNTYVII